MDKFFSFVKKLLNVNQSALLCLILALMLLGSACANSAQGNSPENTTSGETTAAVEQTEYRIYRGGFLVREDRVVSVASGKAELLSLQDAEISFLHNGENVSVTFCWGSAGESVYVENLSSGFSWDPVNGSDRYFVLTKGTQLGIEAVYLVDVQAMEVTVPPFMEDGSIMGRVIYGVSFSPDAKYALLDCDAGETCLLIDCETGTVTDLAEAVGVTVCGGNFLDADNLLLLHKDAYLADTKTDTVSYHIPDGSHTFHSGDVMTFYGGDFATKTVDGMIAIVDPQTMETTVTQFRASDNPRIFYVASGKIGVLDGNALYLMDHAGNTQEISMEDLQ